MDYSTTRATVVAIFNDQRAANAAADQLASNGFGRDRIDVTSADDFARDAASGNTRLTGSTHDSAGGGIAGFFHRLFGSDEDTEERAYYSNAMTSGRSAVVVHADSNESADRAAEILNRNGAVEIKNDDISTADRTRETLADRGTRSDAIPVVKEELQVGKRAVQRGGVRIHTHVTEQPAEEEVRLREERVRVERRPVNRPATDADLAAADRGVIEVTETVEEPVVNKAARVVEEVRVGKDVQERSEKVRDKIRQSEVNVEDTRAGRGVTGAQSGTSNFSDLNSDFENDFRTRYGRQGDVRYDDYAPAYQYGYEMASDPRYRGRRFSDVEQDLRADYSRRYPGSAWDRMKDSIRYGWDKVTGKV